MSVHAVVSAKIRGFYAHVAVFVLINILLHIVNFVAAPTVYRAFWPLLGWGIGLTAHGLATCRWIPFIGNDWEERKIRDLLKRDERER